ncbi:MAG: putative xylanase/chitin deacetylase, partial [Nitrosarchaeum sp.]|nr:putative xylanase/chitin deacetylase [Nitrosarchaeum sp.]
MNHNRNMFLGFSILFLGMIITSSFPISFNETIQTQAYAILDSPIIHMSDTSVGSGRSTASDRPLHAEFVSPTSQLVGDAIDSITMKLKKTNSPTGIAQIGVFNADLTVKKLFGTIDSATMSPSYTDLTFSLPLGQTYQIQSGDLIGIKFTGGDSVNRISTMIDDNAADPFDGTNSYHTYYTTTWNPFPTNDLYMILRQSSTGTTDTTAPVTTATPPGGFYSTLQSVTLTANEAATIYYTTNGSIPTTSSTVYTTAIPISATATLKFFAKDTAGNLEAVKTQTYT